MLAWLAMTLAMAASIPVPSIDTIELPLPQALQEHVVLHCVRPAHATHAAMLFIHGASFPTLLAAGFQFSPGDSWLHDAASHGYLACGLDFLGFGDASRPPAMRGDAKAAAPVTDALQAAGQIALAADYLRDKQSMRSIHVIAHSWGTIPAATFAAKHPGALNSLTLFGPVVPLQIPDQDDSAHTAWWSITAQQRLDQLRFKDVLPRSLYLLEPAVDRDWAAAFAASVPHVPGDPRDALRIPSGPLADIGAVTAGRYPYQASEVQVPVFVVYGDYDTVVNDDGAIRFLAGFTHSPLRWRLRIDDGTHVMHLEQNRRSLYAAVDAFIHAVESRSP